MLMFVSVMLAEGRTETNILIQAVTCGTANENLVL